jgi:integrase
MQIRAPNEKDTMTTRAKRPHRSWGKILRMRSGRYQAGYNGPDLARHYAPDTFTSRMDAEAWLASERRLIERDEWTPPALRCAANHARGKGFGEYAIGWLEQRNLKPRTRQGYSELINGPLAKLGKVPLRMLTSETVRVWHTGLGTATPRKNSHAYGLLHAILGTALSDGLIASNPATIRGAMNTATKRQAVILTPGEIVKVALAIQPVNLKALVLIAAWCGLRWGEITELRRRDISADCTVIYISRGATHRNGQCYIGTPKSGKVRSVDVPPHVVPDLADHLAHLVDAAPDALLFKADRSCHYSEKTFRRHFAESLKSVGITTPVRIHDLRR